MEAHNQPSIYTGVPAAPWGAAFGEPDPCPAGDGPAGRGPRAAGADPLGTGLMAFLTDFRTAQEDELEAARAAATPRRGAGAAGGRPRAALEAEGTTSPAGSDDPYRGSDAPLAPDWWMATDGLWYRPELHPDAQQPAEATEAPDGAPVGGEQQAARSATGAAGVVRTAAAGAFGPGGPPTAPYNGDPAGTGRKRRLVIPGRAGRQLRPSPGPACA